MKRNRLWIICILALAVVMLSTTAFALDESEVENAVAASSRDEVAGNLFIWFLCAVSFLKISQKIDSFRSSLGVNVGRTGGSMLAELMIAGRALGAAAKATGGAVSNIFNRSHASGTTTNQAAGQVFTGGGNGLIGVAQRAAGNAAASSATGRGSGLGSFVGGAMFGSSLKSGGKFASDVVGAVATGNISSVGTITGEKAAQALTSYLGYGAADDSAAGVEHGAGMVSPGTQIPVTPDHDMSQPQEDVIITQDGGSAGADVSVAGSSIPGSTSSGMGGSSPIPSQPPSFRNVEIGGGRITGYETPAGGGEERQFAMYNAAQYMEPTGSFETVETTDGQSWYKQYAEPTVQKTPYKDDSGKIKYEERIVEQMPQIPKRKDRV